MTQRIAARRPGIVATAPGRPGESDRPEAVDVVIPVKTPDKAWLDLTLGALESQTHQPRVTVVDCAAPPVEIETSLESQVLLAASCDRGGQRRAGLAAATGDVVLHLDEDALLTRPRHIEAVLEQLDDPAVAGVGGTVAPIRGNRLGKLSASLAPVKAYFPAHRRALDPTGHEAFPAGRRILSGFDNEDRFLKNYLRRHGAVVQDDRLVVLTDLPTRKQRLGLAGAAGAAAVLGASGRQ